MHKFLIILVVCAMLAQFSQAVVVSDTNINLISGAPISNYGLLAYQDEAATDDTGMQFNLSGQTLSYVAETADEGSDWYLTSSGDEFSGPNIGVAAFPLLVRVTSTGFDTHDLTIGSGDFYLGVNTGEGFSGPGMPLRDIYGWVHLQNTAGTLTMLGNAVAYGEGGIVIGTTQAVPEPGQLPLLFLASLSIGVLTRRRRGMEAFSVAPVSCC